MHGHLKEAPKKVRRVPYIEGTPKNGRHDTNNGKGNDSSGKGMVPLPNMFIFIHAGHDSKHVVWNIIKNLNPHLTSPIQGMQRKNQKKKKRKEKTKGRSSEKIRFSDDSRPFCQWKARSYQQFT
jgi:hypothetical protein